MNRNRAFFAMFERAGFTLIRCTNHAIWNCPCGHTKVTSARTPGKGKAWENSQAQIARTLRCCNGKEESPA